MSDEIQNACQKCETNLSQEYLRDLTSSPYVWSLCPNRSCDQVHARTSVGFDQMSRGAALAKGMNVRSH